MVRWYFTRSLGIILLFIFSAGAFAQTRLNTSYEGETVTFKAEKNIRFYADYEAETLTIPGATLATMDVFFPPRFMVTVYEDHLDIDVGGSFRATLSPDEKTLTVVRGQPLASPPVQIAGDERAPVMYRLSNAEPADVAALLKSMYANLKVDVDARQRALLVMVNPEDRELIDAMILSLDQARPQVMFEAEILEINQSMTQSLGINYDSIFTFKLTEGEVSSPLSLGSFGRSGLSLTFGLNLLKTNGAANVLARPRVTTIDGVQAQINATQTFPVVVSSSNGQQSVQNITTGIKLTMLPRISPDGLVEAELNISVSTPTGITSQQVPTFSSREASTTVRVANGEPIAIGGLFEKRNLTGVQKVPILGDIPLIGALFTSTSTEERETDLVIVVTPRIVDMPILPTTSEAPVAPVQVDEP